MESVPNHQKPLLDPGTGFHRDVTGENHAFECVYLCQKLLRAVPNRMVLRLHEYSVDTPKLQRAKLTLDGVKFGIYDEHENTFPTK